MPHSPLVGDTVVFRVHGAPRQRAALQERVQSDWRIVRRVRVGRGGTVQATVRIARAGTLAFRVTAGSKASNVVRLRARANGRRIKPLPHTVMLPTGDARSVKTASGKTTVVLGSSARPSRGEIIVLPATKQTPGVLGRVVAVSANSNGTATVTTTPVTLDQAFSQFSVALSGTIGELTRHNTVRLIQGEHPTSATSFPLTCKTSTGTAIHPVVDLSKMHLDFSLTATPPSIHFILEGQPTFGFQVQTTGNLNCSLRDPVPLTVLVPGTPIVVKIAPRFDISATGTTTLNVSWSPRIFIGFDRAPGLAQDFHIIAGTATSVTANLTGHASAWMAGTLDVSLAGRVGVVGAFGPLTSGDATAPPPCVTLNATLKATLDAYADVFFKNFIFSLASGSYGNLQLYRQCGVSGSYAVDVDWATGKWSLNGQAYSPTTDRLGRFATAPLSFLGTPDGCRNIGGQAQAYWGSINLNGAVPSVLMNWEGAGCGAATGLLNVFVASTHDDIPIRSPQGDFTLGTSVDAIPGSIRSRLTSTPAPPTETLLSECIPVQGTPYKRSLGVYLQGQQVVGFGSADC